MTGPLPDPRPPIVDEGTSALDDHEIEVVEEEIPAQTLVLDTRAAADAARRAALPFVAAESDPDLAPTAKIKLKAPLPAIADASTTAPIPAQGAIAPPPLVGPIQIIAESPLTAGAVVWRTRGEKRITAIVKATFELRHGEAARLVAARPIVTRDRWDHAVGGILPSEIAPYLPSAGVTLTGHARAPLGEPAPIVEVRLVIARSEPVLDKVVHVYGDRGATPSAPRPFVDMPLRYERAYGGLGTENPVGTGAGRHMGALPNLLDPIDPSRAAGFGPIPASWSIRRRLLGAADPGSLAAEVPEIPVDLDWQYFQSAPVDQRIDFLRGDERILLEGVHPAIPRFEARLPGVRPKVVRRTATPGSEVLEAPIDLVADTLSIDVDRWTCSVIWRGQWAIGDEVALSSISVLASIAEADRDPPRPAIVAPSRPALVDAVGAAPPPSSRTPSRPAIVESAHSAPPPSSRVAPPRSAIVEADSDGPPPPSRAHPPAPASTPMPPPAIPETGIRAEVLGRLRAGEPLHGLDLAGADLAGIDFSGAMLARLDLHGARLARCTFTDARLAEARLTEADLTSATLIAADLSGADLSRATLAEARLDRALLTDVNLSAARGAGASFEGASGRRATFARGAWEGAIFSGVDLASPDFSGASLARARFEGATLIDARLDDARAEGAVLDGARMPQVRAAGASLTEGSLRGVEAEGSIWERATLEGARFDGAKLKGAILARAACDRASFAGADLTGADLQHLHADRADLSAAILRGAVIRGAHLADARLEGADLREVAGHKADLSGGRLARADLGQAVLRGARLKRASLVGARLDGASLLDADLEEADVSRASMQGTKFGGANLKGLIRESSEP